MWRDDPSGDPRPRHGRHARLEGGRGRPRQGREAEGDREEVFLVHPLPIYVKTNGKVDADVDEDEDDDEENTDDLETEDDEENDEEGKENNEANGVRVGAGKRAEGNLVANHGRQPLRT